MMSIKEYIQQNYENCQRMSLLKFGAKSDELILLKCVFEENWNDIKKWSKKKYNKIAESLFSFIADLEFHAFNFDLIQLLYLQTHPTHYEFMKSLNIEVPIEFDDDRTRIDFGEVVVGLDFIHAYVDQWWDVDDDFIYKVLDYSKQQGWLSYEKGTFENAPCIVVSCVKDPQLNLAVKNDLKERFEPISISKGQDQIRDILYNNNIPFIQEYGIIIDNKKYRFDFAVYGENGIKYFIEYDGEQHFKAVEQWGGEQGLKDRQVSDAAKSNWAKEKGIPLIRIPYTEKNISLADVSLHYSRYIS